MISFSKTSHGTYELYHEQIEKNLIGYFNKLPEVGWVFFPSRYGLHSEELLAIAQKLRELEQGGGQ